MEIWAFLELFSTSVNIWYSPRSNISCHCSLRHSIFVWCYTIFSASGENCLPDPSSGCQVVNLVHANPFLETKSNSELKKNATRYWRQRHVKQMSVNGIWRDLGIVLYCSQHHSTPPQISAAVCCSRRAVGKNPWTSSPLVNFLLKLFSNSWRKNGLTDWSTKK